MRRYFFARKTSREQRKTLAAALLDRSALAHPARSGDADCALNAARSSNLAPLRLPSKPNASYDRTRHAVSVDRIQSQLGESRASITSFPYARKRNATACYISAVPMIPSAVARESQMDNLMTKNALNRQGGGNEDGPHILSSRQVDSQNLSIKKSSDLAVAR